MNADGIVGIVAFINWTEYIEAVTWYVQKLGIYEQTSPAGFTPVVGPCVRAEPLFENRFARLNRKLFRRTPVLQCAGERPNFHEKAELIDQKPEGCTNLQYRKKSSGQPR